MYFKDKQFNFLCNLHSDTKHTNNSLNIIEKAMSETTQLHVPVILRKYFTASLKHILYWVFVT